MKCSEVKLGQVYTCNDCGLELKVVKECDCSTESCSCDETSRCGGGITLKE
ncbi:MAG: hypothetical protein WBC63_09370 [Candidatus Bipolaricaulia bacterium]